MRTLDETITAAHRIVHVLLRTEVTRYDVATALETCCPDWSEQDAAATLRLAVEFAQIEGDAVLLALDRSYARNMAQMEHCMFMAYELGDHLDLPVDIVWSEEDRERSILHRHVLYPLPPDAG